jgi:pyrroline-5-carboxylate reductase
MKMPGFDLNQSCFNYLVMEIAILGGGNLGAAIARGIVKSKLTTPSSITITRRHLPKLEQLKFDGYSITSDNQAAVKSATIVILAVQPKQLAGLIQEIAPAVTDKHILVSTITGISTEEIATHLGKKVAIVRAMPNTAVAIGASMTCLCARDTNEKQLADIRKLFDSVGITLVIEERLMKAATVLAASGIAFYMRYIRAATQGGIQMGFDAEEAQLIAGQTARGAASLLLDNDTHPEIEIDKVTTPEGCTIAGLNEMEHQGLSSALIKGIIASFDKINTIKK